MQPRRILLRSKDLNKDHILPVQMVSTDHYILRAPGRLFHTIGKSDPSNMYSGGCVLIEHASGYMSIKNQVVINATETVKEKLIFEREDKSQGVMINVDHTENGIFNNSKFTEELLKKQQNIRFSGASESHQNGAAERAIKTVVNMEKCHIDASLDDMSQGHIIHCASLSHLCFGAKILEARS